MNAQEVFECVIPAQAGSHNVLKQRDSRLHGNDKKRVNYSFYDAILIDERARKISRNFRRIIKKFNLAAAGIEAFSNTDKIAQV